MAKRVGILKDWFIRGSCDKEEFGMVVSAPTERKAFDEVARIKQRHVVRLMFTNRGYRRRSRIGPWVATEGVAASSP